MRRERSVRMRDLQCAFLLFCFVQSLLFLMLHSKSQKGTGTIVDVINFFFLIYAVHNLFPLV
jgi:hypothetical protein